MCTDYVLGCQVTRLARIFSTSCCTTIIHSAFHSGPFALIRNSNFLSGPANFIACCSPTQTVSPVLTGSSARDTVPWTFKWAPFALIIQASAQESPPKRGLPRSCIENRPSVHPSRSLTHNRFVLFISLTYHHLILSYRHIY